MSGEMKRLQTANSNLQKERDHIEDEKEDVLKDLERQTKENDRWYCHCLFYLLLIKPVVLSTYL